MMPVESGRLAGRYELRRLRGAGPVGQVWEAHDHQTATRVAVKTYHAHLVEDATFRAGVRRAATESARIGHPGAVAVLDTGDGRYLVTEYVDAPSVRALLDDHGPLRPEFAVELAFDACTALGAAHEQGVAHRNVKPENLLVVSGCVRVTDFALAATASGAPYLAPEVTLTGEGDTRSDLYALGCCLYEMVTGRPPFEGPTPFAVAARHTSADPVPPRAAGAPISPELEAVILRSLAKDPADRFQSARQLRLAVQQIALGKAAPGKAAPESRSTRSPAAATAPQEAAELPAPAQPDTASRPETATPPAAFGQRGFGPSPAAAPPATAPLATPKPATAEPLAAAIPPETEPQPPEALDGPPTVPNLPTVAAPPPTGPPEDTRPPMPAAASPADAEPATAEPRAAAMPRQTTPQPPEAVDGPPTMPDLPAVAAPPPTGPLEDASPPMPVAEPARRGRRDPLALMEADRDDLEPDVGQDAEVAADRVTRPVARPRAARKPALLGTSRVLAVLVLAGMVAGAVTGLMGLTGPVNAAPAQPPATSAPAATAPVSTSPQPQPAPEPADLTGVNQLIDLIADDTDAVGPRGSAFMERLVKVEDLSGDQRVAELTELRRIARDGAANGDFTRWFSEVAVDVIDDTVR